MKLLIKFLNLAKRYYYIVVNQAVFKVNNVNKKPNYKINGKIFIRNSGIISIGKNFVGNSSKNANPIGGDIVLRLIVNKGGELTIGDNVGISNSTIVCWHKIEIGNYVYIGGNCKIWDTDFHSIDPYERRNHGDKKVIIAPVHIGDYAFIGGSSIILKGVHIGENSIIAAGSVVTKNIPNNEIWGGNPAKYIRSLDSKKN